MTDLTERLRELLADATPGPWHISRAGATIRADKLLPAGQVSTRIAFGYDGTSDARAIDFRLIIELRNNADDLLTTLETLTQEKEALRHKLWMVACHATGGGMRDIAGIDQSINDICVQISASRNLVWAEAQKHAAKDLTQENARLREALGETLRVYVELAESGDAGFWDPEEEPHVIAARKALGGGDEQ